MSALGAVSEAALKIVKGFATDKGVEIDPEEAIKLAAELLQIGAELIDGHAKKKAEAAGDAAAAAITTEDQAEAAQRKP